MLIALYHAFCFVSCFSALYHGFCFVSCVLLSIMRFALYHAFCFVSCVLLCILRSALYHAFCFVLCVLLCIMRSALYYAVFLVTCVLLCFMLFLLCTMHFPRSLVSAATQDDIHATRHWDEDEGRHSCAVYPRKDVHGAERSLRKRGGGRGAWNKNWVIIRLDL